MLSDIKHLVNSPDFVAFMCGAAAFGVVLLIWSALVENRPSSDRLKAVSQRRSEFEKDRRKKNSRRASMQKISLMKQVVDWFKLTQGKSLAELRLKLRRAGYQARDAMFIFMFTKLVLMGGAFAVGFFFLVIVGVGDLETILAFLGAFGAGILGWVIPDAFIKNLSQQREEVLRKAIPDALDLMVICAEAGLGLDAAFERVGREIAPTCHALAEEIGITSVELNFMPDRHKALQALADRVPLSSVMALVNTLIQTEKYGTPLAQSLRVLSSEMRDERMMKAEEKAAKLPAILTVPMIVFILPPLFVVLIGPAALKVADSM